MEKKAYSKPTITVVELRPEERIAASLDEAHKCRNVTTSNVTGIDGNAPEQQ